MAQFEQWFSQDLTEKIEIRHCESVMFSGDDKGVVVGVHLFNGGAAYSGGGTVSGKVIRSDGAEVALTGTINGNDVSVELLESCLAVPGPIGIYIRLTANSQKATVLSAVYTVQATSTGTIVDPGTIIPDIDDLIERIDTAIGEIPSDYSALMAAVAPTFSATAQYHAGYYVWYNGELYQFTANHDAGSWDATQAVKVPLSKAVGEMQDESRIYEYLTNNGQYTVTAADMENGAWSYSSKVNNTKRVRIANLIPVRAGMQISYSTPTLRLGFWVLPSKTATGSFAQNIGFQDAGSSGVISITADGYLIVMADSTNNITVADYDCRVVICVDWKKSYSGYENLIAPILSKKTETKTGVTFTWSSDYSECTAGGTATGSALYTSQIFRGSSSYIPPEYNPGEKYLVMVKTTDSNFVLGAAFYKNGAYNSTVVFSSNGILTIPSDATGMFLFVGVPKDKTVTNAKISHMIICKTFSQDMTLGLHGYPQYVNSIYTAQEYLGNGMDANNAKANTFTMVTNTGLNIQHLPGGENYTYGMLVTLSYNGDQNANSGKAQFYITQGGVFSRIQFTAGWTEWSSDSSALFVRGYPIRIGSVRAAQEYFGNDLSADNAKVNTFTMISNTSLGIQNLPGGSKYTYGQLITLSNSGVQGDAGAAQLYVTTTGVYTRLRFNSGWTEWSLNVKDAYDAAVSDVDNTFAVEFELGSWNYGNTKADSTTRIRSKELYPVKKGMVIEYTSPSLETCFAIVSGINTGSAGTLETLSWVMPDTDKRYFYINYNGYLSVMYEKMDGSAISINDNDGTIKLLTQNSRQSTIMPTLNRHTCNIFKRVVCIGDSFTAGTIKETSSASWYINEKYAWPHYMSLLTGNEWINCGVSGSNTITWQSDAGGLAKAQAIGRAQAYLIGLGINDSSERQDLHVDVGTSADIGSDAQTYYAQMAKIIREVNAISPIAKIFVTTLPRDTDRYYPYIQAVRDIYNAYKNTYPIHLLDLQKHMNLYRNLSLTNDYVSGHQTAIGYEQFAEIYTYIISDYINNHVSDFQNIHRIPFDETNS